MINVVYSKQLAKLFTTSNGWKSGWIKNYEPLKTLCFQGFWLVEHRGFEPLTSTMRTLRATNCANAPRMIGGFVQTSVETASRNCTARTQQEPSFHTLFIVHLARFTVRTKLAGHIIPRPMGECKGCFCKFIEDCMISLPKLDAGESLTGLHSWHKIDSGYDC